MRKWNKRNLFLNLLIKDYQSLNNNWNNKFWKDKIKITLKDKDYLLFNDFIINFIFIFLIMSYYLFYYLYFKYLF